MTLKQMTQLNKAEICWYSFISGMAQYPNNSLDYFEYIRIIDRYILIIAELTNMKNGRQISWRYRFNLEEKHLADLFIQMIKNELPHVEIVESERRD